MSFESLVKRIDNLPPLSDSVQRILSLYAQEEDDVDLRTLTRLIQNDTLLAANILRMINAPEFSFSNKITSVGQAVSLFGTSIVKGFILSIAMKDMVQSDMKTYGMGNEKFNDMGHLQSALLFQWYKSIDIKRTKKLVPLALVMETGKVVFAQEMASSDYKKLFTEELFLVESMKELEEKYSGTTSYFIGGLLFEHWNFSQYYSDLMKRLDYDDDNISIDQLDLDILNVVRTVINIKGFITRENVIKALKLVRELNMDEANFMKTLLQIKTAYVNSKRAKD